VLGDFRNSEVPVIEEEIARSVALLPLLSEGKLQIAMNKLHTRPSP